MWEVKKYHLGTKNIFEKNAFFGTKMAQNAPKMAQNGPKWDLQGAAGGQIRVFEAPRPFGNTKKSIWSKKDFVKKTRFFAVFGTHFGHFVCKMGPNGLSGGPKPVFSTPNQLRTP